MAKKAVGKLKMISFGYVCAKLACKDWGRIFTAWQMEKIKQEASSRNEAKNICCSANAKV